MPYKLISSFFQSHKKAIKKIFLGLVLLAMNDAASSAMDEIEDSDSSFPAASSESEIDEMGKSESSSLFKKELSHKTSEECTFADWMGILGGNTFKEKSLENQNHFKEEVIQHAAQIAKLICQEINISKNRRRPLSGKEAPQQEDQEKIAGYIRQIVNDKNPLHENPLVAMKDQNNPNHQLVNSIARVLCKVVTGEYSYIRGEFVPPKFFAYLSAAPNFLPLSAPQEEEFSGFVPPRFSDLPAAPDLLESITPQEEELKGPMIIRQRDIAEKLNDPFFSSSLETYHKE